MSGNYRPELREVFAQCWTEGTWLSGGICLPARRGLLDHLNQKDPFLKFRDVAISQKREPLAFLALRRDRVAMLVPPEHEPLPHSGATSTSHRVVCLLKGAMATGTLETLANLRVSDYLMRGPGFFALRDCTLRVVAKAELPFPNPVPLILVNADAVIGVAESS